MTNMRDLINMVSLPMITEAAGSGTNQLKRAMDAETYHLLMDLNRWRAERKELAAQRQRDRARKRGAVRRNDVVKVANLSMQVPDIDQWIEDGDDDRMFAISLKNGWGGIKKLPSNVRDDIAGDPGYRAVCMAIWQEGAKTAYGRRDDLAHGQVGPNTVLYRIMNIVIRPHLINHHVDRKGLRIGPNERHPEADLPVSTQGLNLGAYRDLVG